MSSQRCGLRVSLTRCVLGSGMSSTSIPPGWLEEAPHLRKITPRFLALAVCTVALAASGSPARAQLTPLFTVPGVVNNGTLGTFFACTNTDTATVTIAVEVFDQAGASKNAPSTTAVSVAPQGTVLVGTTGAATFTADALLNPQSIEKGSARVLATSKKVVCSAFLADLVNVPPISMTTLSIVVKGKQRGD
jgi:hypothetical protein